MAFGVSNVKDRGNNGSIARDESLGVVMYPLRNMHIGSTISQWFPLGPRNSGDKVSGEVNLTLTLQPSN